MKLTLKKNRNFKNLPLSIEKTIEKTKLLFLRPRAQMNPFKSFSLYFRSKIFDRLALA